MRRNIFKGMAAFTAVCFSVTLAFAEVSVSGDYNAYRVTVASDVESYDMVGVMGFTEEYFMEFDGATHQYRYYSIAYDFTGYVTEYTVDYIVNGELINTTTITANGWDVLLPNLRATSFLSVVNEPYTLAVFTKDDPVFINYKIKNGVVGNMNTNEVLGSFEYDSNNTGNTDITQALQAINLKLDTIDNQNLQIGNKLDNIQNQNEHVADNIGNISSQNDQMAVKLNSISSQHQQTDVKIDGISNLNLQIDTKIDEIRNRNEEVDLKLDNISSQNEQIGAKIDTIDNQNLQIGNKLENIQNQNEQISNNIGNISSQNDQMAVKLNSISSQHQQTDTKIDNIDKQNKLIILRVQQIKRTLDKVHTEYLKKIYYYVRRIWQKVRRMRR